MASQFPTGMEEAVTASDSRDAAVRSMLFTVLCSLVNDADKLELIHVTVAEGVAFQVRCAPDDVGKIIGKQGRTARAIRTILGAISMKNKRRYSLDIAEAMIQGNA